MRNPAILYTTSYLQVVPLNQYSFTGGNISTQITAFGDQREGKAALAQDMQNDKRLLILDLL
jgi:hypothetical protein